MAQHKWHKEIKAWADGAEIESSDIYIDRQMWKEVSIPCWDNDRYLFRIKPQPKEPQYLYVWSTEIGITLTEPKDKVLSGYEYIGKIKLETDDAD